MGVFEEDLKKKFEEGKDLPERLDIPMIKYFWQASPLSGTRKTSIPKFLRKIEVFKIFSDNELRILTKFLHHRTFSNGECIFKQGDMGVGFYLLFSGHIDIIVADEHADDLSEEKDKATRLVVSLERTDTFGELALLRDGSIRNATAVARESCELLGIYKPDIEELITLHPVVAAKLLQSISVIVANRLFSITKEVRMLKYKIMQLEKEVAKNQGE